MKVFKKKDEADQKKQAATQAKLSAQEWLPFNDVFNGFIYRRDKHLAMVGRIEPLNIALKANKEKEKIIAGVHEAINPQMEEIHFYTIPRPLDLDYYLEQLEQKATEVTSPLKKRLFREYIRYIAGVVRGGKAMERRYYTAVTQPPGKQQKEELHYVGNEFISRLGGGGLSVTSADDTAILDMLFSFLQPGRAAYETPPDGAPNFIISYKGGSLADEE